MPRKGMRTVFYRSSRPASPSYGGSSSPLQSPSPRHTFSSTIMEENIEIAESVIRKWDVEDKASMMTNYSKIESLFRGDRTEATEFLRSVKDLQSAMQFFVSEGGSSSAMIIRAQNLMQTAMKRLEKEFYHILSTNRNYLDPESVSSRASTVSDFEEDGSEDEIQVSTTDDSTVTEMAMNDLKTIVESMISSGYTKECVKIYKLIRKSIVDESLYYLGVERLMSNSQFQKTDWEVIELKIKNWLNAVKVAVKTIFHGEKILCENVFGTSPVIQESCFADITRESAQALIGFPEQVSKFTKLSPEKIFRVLDLYDSLSELWPEIEFIFSTESDSTVRSQAVTSLVKLGDAVRTMLSEFEEAIQKDASKSPIPGGGVHPLTRYVMNYIVFLSDYSGSLSDIVADWPLSVMSPLPESYFSSPISDESPSSAISVRLAWIVLVLLCKLDSKTELYKDVSLSYLFLANNLNYVVSKVRTSNLKLLLGDDWLDKHEIKVKQYASNYERMGWTRVMSSLPELNPTVGINIVTPEAAKDCFKRFNKEFEEAYRKQTSWVVFDSRLRDEIKISLARKLVPAYREFYEKYRVMFRREMGVESVVRYAPDDLGNYLSDLFYGTGASTSISSSSSTSSSSSHSRDRRFH